MRGVVGQQGGGTGLYTCRSPGVGFVRRVRCRWVALLLWVGTCAVFAVVAGHAVCQAAHVLTTAPPAPRPPGIDTENLTMLATPYTEDLVGPGNTEQSSDSGFKVSRVCVCCGCEQRTCPRAGAEKRQRGRGPEARGGWHVAACHPSWPAPSSQRSTYCPPSVLHPCRAGSSP